MLRHTGPTSSQGSQQELGKPGCHLPFFSTQMKSLLFQQVNIQFHWAILIRGSSPRKFCRHSACGISEWVPDKEPLYYNFQNFNLSSAGMYMNDQAVPQLPHSLDFSEGVYTSAYLSMFTAQNLEKNDCGLNVSLSDYAQGYCLLSFDTKPDVEQDEKSEPAYGNVRLELRFKTPLEKAINVILYSIFYILEWIQF